MSAQPLSGSQGLGVSSPRRIGVFGGAFDPPHHAHVTLVNCAIHQLQLDEVRVLPTGQAWHKARTLTGAEHRLMMTRAAFEGVPQVVIDEREVQRLGPSYTVDSLLELASEYPGALFFLLIGDDQRRTLPFWHRIEDIARLAIICAAARPADVIAWSSGPSSAQQGSDSCPVDVLTLQMPLMPLSATEIRERLAQNQPISGWVPAAVERYIHEHHLYGDCRESHR